MATYAIGDLQGCFDALRRLLDKINYDATKDQLWFTGDLINRGPKSLATLRFVKDLGSKAITVLGNHDLGTLTVARGAEPFETEHHTFQDILEAEDKEDLLLWLEQLPLLHYDPNLNYVLVHAGLYPWWDLKLALTLAKEVETVLRSKDKFSFYKHHYGNMPDHWQENLTGFDRLRFIVNAFTRMRFCSLDGKLELTIKESANNAPKGCYPWFELWDKEQQKRNKYKDKKNKEEGKNVGIGNTTHNPFNIIFGHWAALKGECPIPYIFALDTGCVWGRSLTAMRLEDGEKFVVDCAAHTNLF